MPVQGICSLEVVDSNYKSLVLSKGSPTSLNVLGPLSGLDGNTTQTFQTEYGWRCTTPSQGLQLVLAHNLQALVIETDAEEVPSSAPTILHHSNILQFALQIVTQQHNSPSISHVRTGRQMEQDNLAKLGCSTNFFDEVVILIHGPAFTPAGLAMNNKRKYQHRIISSTML
ncbi:hypothetical protein HAX54_006308 [Datura stramonium]|uniref:Uncharacterized protein n=1 Tax=Datura stramonium TaxID=4076 RepID=A0ABS8WWF0_DATST|nr:hypothetical protein [Datura stramonium]